MRTSSYRSFILDLYHATHVSGYSWLHGLKLGRMVHVGTVDAPVTNGDAKQIVAEFRKAVGTGKDAPSTKGVDILGWDFAFELNEVARQDAEKAGIDLRLVRIPREVLEKRAVEQGDIRFFELAALSVGMKQSGRKVTLTLEDSSSHWMTCLRTCRRRSRTGPSGSTTGRWTGITRTTPSTTSGRPIGPDSRRTSP